MKDLVDDFPGKQFKVSGVLREMDIGEPIDQPIRFSSEPHLEGTFPVTMGARRMDDVDAGPETVHHFRNEFRRILQIRVHVHNGVPPRLTESSKDTRGYTEATRHVDNGNGKGPLKIFEDGKGSVAGIIVDKDEFGFDIGEPVKGGMCSLYQLS
jgi:hypothetical protein